MIDWQLVGGHMVADAATISIDDGDRIVRYRAMLTNGVYPFRDEHGDRIFTKDPTPDELRAMLRFLGRSPP